MARFFCCRTLPLLAVLGAATTLGGCVAYPGYGYQAPAYGYGYGYSYPYYATPTIGFNFGGWGGHYWHGGWHDRGWH
jgi:hypothetical protein